MRTVLLLAACSGLATGAAAQATPRDLVARAIAAMGGDSALRAIRTVTREYYGANYALGQEETPSSPARANTTVASTIVDHAAGRLLVTSEIRAVNGQVNRSRRVLVGDIAMLDNNGQLSASAPGATRADQAGIRRSPERLLLAALDNPGALAPLAARTWRGDRMAGVRYRAGADTLNLWFDPASGLLTVMETVTDDPILGDRQSTTWYTRWQPAAGVLFPRQIDVMVNGRLQTHLVFTAVTVSPAVPDSLFVIPDSIKSRAQPGATPPTPPTVTLVELAPGVWRAEGGSHHSLVVDQGATLVVVEAPQNAARFNAVLDTLRSRFPGKRVGTVVNTHHHWDHSGGVRAALAAGLAVATHERNAEFVRQVGTATKSIAPDSLSRVPRAAFLAAVADSLVLGTGDTRVVLYALPTTHCEGMLAAYLPGAQLLFVSDVLTPGPTLAPVGSRELVAFARKRGITIARVAGGHGGVAAWADVEAAAR